METLVTLVDRIRSEYQAKRISRAAALAAIMDGQEITPAGAADLLDHKQPAGVRYPSALFTGGA